MNDEIFSSKQSARPSGRIGSLTDDGPNGSCVLERSALCGSAAPQKASVFAYRAKHSSSYSIRSVFSAKRTISLTGLLSEMPTNRPGANFLFAHQQARMRRVATRLGSTVALVANELINEHFKSPAENCCRW